MRPNRIKLKIYDGTSVASREEIIFIGEFTQKNIKDALLKFSSLNHFDYIDFYVSAINNHVKLSVTKAEINYSKNDDLTLIIYESLSSRLMKTIFHNLIGNSN